jgi:uncharacterized protein involved in exopolysaccharide biosynthesis
MESSATEREPNLLERVAVLRRRWQAGAITGGAVLLLTLAIALLWPPTYRASGTILIEQQEIPSEFIQSAISSYADQRVQLITQRVMTVDNLLAIIGKYELYAEDRDNETREKIIERMRDDISLEMISADVVDPRIGRPVRATIAFSIGYESRSPELAVRVANELTSLYLSENVETRTRVAAETNQFFEGETERLRVRIAELEGQLATFKSQYDESLPERLQLNITLANRAEEEMRDIEARLRSLDEQEVFLSAQLAQLSPDSKVLSDTGEMILSPSDRLKSLRSQYAVLSARYSPEHPDVVRMKREIEGLEAEVGSVGASRDLVKRLDEARGQLAQARKRYAPDHPDVRQLEALIVGMEQSMRDTPATASALRAADDPDNPAYIQIKAQLDAARSDRSALEGRRSELRGRVGELERWISSTPGVERDYLSLTRELEGTRIKYQDVRQKQMEAQLAENLETQRKGEKFTMIEPPMRPEEPVSPNRPLLLLVGFGLALIAAIAGISVREALDAAVRDRGDLARLVEVAPLAVIPWIETDEDRARGRRQRKLAFLASGASAVVALVLLHLLLMPLDTLWFVALRRLGM